MRHTRVERWSRFDSAIHRRHASAKIVAVLTFLICAATLRIEQWLVCLVYLSLLICATLISGLPLKSLMLRAAAILPFALFFAIISAIAGEPARAVMLLVRGYLSGFAALLLISTTSQPAVIAGLESLHAPRFLLQVMQFLYRYLVVLGEEAAAMRDAGLSRGGSVRNLEIRRAAGTAAVLFAKAYARATAIHQAMCARGFEGMLPRTYKHPFLRADTLFLLLCVLLTVTPRLVLA